MVPSYACTPDAVIAYSGNGNADHPHRSTYAALVLSTRPASAPPTLYGNTVLSDKSYQPRRALR
jgi:hypothetical protein